MASGYSGFIIDLDGCTYIGERLTEGAKEALDKLERLGVKVLFLTNNSGYTSEDYSMKLKRLGIDWSPEEILTSGEAASKYILARSGKSKILAVTGRGFKEYCRRMGHEVLPLARWAEAKYLVVGHDREISYEKLKAGLRAVLSGAEFIATNTDKTFPAPDGLEPGAGAIVASFKEMTGVDPIVIGKPSRIIMEMALERLGMKPEEVLVVGDRIETDIMAGKNIGSDTALVLTGVSKLDEVKGLDESLKPTYVADNLLKLVELIYP